MRGVCQECGAPLAVGKSKYCSSRCLKIATNREARRRYAEKRKNRVVCLNCFEWFERKHSNQVYCSEKCRKEAEKKRGGTRKMKVCPVCGAEFAATPNKTYCSVRCRRKAADIKRKENPLQKICDECGKPFETTRKNQRFCNHNCASKASAKRHRKKIKIEAGGLDATLAEMKAAGYEPWQYGEYKKMRWRETDHEVAFRIPAGVQASANVAAEKRRIARKARHGELDDLKIKQLTEGDRREIVSKLKSGIPLKYHERLDRLDDFTLQIFDYLDVKYVSVKTSDYVIGSAFRELGIYQ